MKPSPPVDEVTPRRVRSTSLSGAELPGWPYRYAVDAALSEHDMPGQGAATPLVADLDGDGSPEIMAPLQGGALLVWDRWGGRLKELEATLPAWKAASPLFLPTENDGPRLVGLAQYERVLGFTVGRDSLQTSRRTELAVWDWPQLQSADVVWGQWGGDATGAFHLAFDRQVPSSANDASLGSFQLGPNPASTELRARVQLSEAARVSCTLFNLEGEIVQRQERQGVTGELVEFIFDLRQMASSPYLARMQLSTGGQKVRPFVVQR
jgi:hypothetical protein